MENRVAALLALLATCFVMQLGFAEAITRPDLPSPRANPTTIEAGAYIIPMDDTNANSQGEFNLKAYGLIVKLAHADIPILWAIKAGKAKDAEDFSASVKRTAPTASSTVETKSFAGGPFIITQDWTADADPVIASHGGNVYVYELQEDTVVDVRHNILIKPKALISNVGGKANTQTAIFVEAGLTEGVHYSVAATSADVEAIDGDTCYTLITEPHYEWTSLKAPAYYSALKSFVISGGNFLAQCAGIDSYENYAVNTNPDASGGFMTQHGIKYDKATNNQNLEFLQPDLPYSQFIGSIDGSNGGHTTEYYLIAPNEASLTTNDVIPLDVEDTWWVNNGHAHVINRRSVTNAQGANQRTNILTASAKLTGACTVGSMVYYLPSHTWAGKSGRLGTNGRRILMNAYLTPSARPGFCGLSFCPEGSDCGSLACATCTCRNGQAEYTPIPYCCSCEDGCSEEECVELSGCIWDATEKTCSPFTGVPSGGGDGEGGGSSGLCYGMVAGDGDGTSGDGSTSDGTGGTSTGGGGYGDGDGDGYTGDGDGDGDGYYYSYGDGDGYYYSYNDGDDYPYNYGDDDGSGGGSSGDDGRDSTIAAVVASVGGGLLLLCLAMTVAVILGTLVWGRKLKKQTGQESA